MIRLLLLLLYSSSYLLGHTLKPAYLEIKSIGENKYATKWKAPLFDNKELSIAPIFPKICQKSLTNRVKDSNILFISHLLICKETLLGKDIFIQNIENEMRTVIFHFSENNLSYFSELNPTHPSINIKSATNHSQNTLNYIVLGIKHILLGYDHLLFVLGLLLLIQRGKILIQTITAFTLAHSITLGASALGYISISEIFIEIIIALSIVILAVEILYAQRGKIGLCSKYPWGVALFFGLIHGFGFANVLAELTLPQEHIILALLFFNIGIELGQIFFISLLLIVYYIFRFFMKEQYLLQGKTLVAYSIGTIASYWFIERLFSIFTY